MVRQPKSIERSEAKDAERPSSPLVDPTEAPAFLREPLKTDLCQSDSSSVCFPGRASMSKDLSEGGAKDEGSELEPGSDPALQGNERQSVKNQGKARPEDYPGRHEQG
jgi:hypothetical protein